MKYLILGDNEGRQIWKDIIPKENPDITIFLGDYVASRVFGITPEKEIENLEELLTYKEENPDKVYLLRGNHDEEIFYHWAQCWPASDEIVKEWGKNNKDRFNKNTQWIYQIPDTNIICSHAGISKIWLEKFVQRYLVNKIGPQYDDGTIDMESILNLINSIEPCEVFAFNGDYFDICGTSITQPCTWIRPETLVKCAIDNYIQIVGHTRTNKSYKYSDNPEIWLCDSLNFKGYLIIEDGKFKPKTL